MHPFYSNQSDTQAEYNTSKTSPSSNIPFLFYEKRLLFSPNLISMKLKKIGGKIKIIYPENCDDSWKYEFSWSFRIFPDHNKAGIWIWFKLMPRKWLFHTAYLDNHYKQM